MAEAIYTEYNGAATITCSTLQGGNCVLNQNCEYFFDFWFNYSIGLYFEGQNYILVPLSTFAVDNGDGQCLIYV